MSTIDFNERGRISITIDISGGGQFDPAAGSIVPIAWGIQGTVTAVDGENNLTTKEKLCGFDNSLGDKIYTAFSATPSVGGNSGRINTGIFPNPINPQIFGTNLGTWKVNTSPVLSSDGQVNGELAQKGYYIAQVAQGQKYDDPIVISPAIDGITRIYAGDIIYTAPYNEGRRWYILPQERQPNPDRTLFWNPNQEPYVEENGKIDGKLAKPGTIILPTSTFDFEDDEQPFYGRYALAGQGWLWNGYTWLGGGAPFKWKPTPTSVPQYRFIDVSYTHPDYTAGCMEEAQRNKPFVYTTKRVDDSTPVLLTYYPEGSEPYDISFKFRWLSDFYGAGGIQGRSVVHDFGDAWSKYHLANIAWAKENEIFELTGLRCDLTNDEADPPVLIELLSEVFEDGNITTIKTEAETPEGDKLTNIITVTLTINTSIA
jgi:hypothetical protein